MDEAEDTTDADRRLGNAPAARGQSPAADNRPAPGRIHTMAQQLTLFGKCICQRRAPLGILHRGLQRRVPGALRA